MQMGSNIIEIEMIQEQLGKKKGELVTQDTVDELNRLVDDPEYGEEFLDSYVSYFNIMEGNSTWSTPKYMNAMKFFTLIEGGHSAVDAYVKTFPDRLQARIDRGQGKDNMGGESSRYNASALVNEIRKVASIPVQLIHRHLLHEAIMVSADLMMNANSEIVQQKAAETLIKELKPAEDTTIQLKVGMDDESRNAQNTLVAHIGALALSMQQAVAAGSDIGDVQKLNIKRPEIVEAELEDDDDISKV